MEISSRVRTWLTSSEADPSVRLRYWLEVDGRRESDPRVRTARRQIGRTGWAAWLLESRWPDGHWVAPRVTRRSLYLPKYSATNWSAIVLADLGMTRSDPRIRRTAELILRLWSEKGWPLGPGGDEICVTGNMVRTLIRFGYLEDSVVRRSIDWIVRSQTKDGGWHCWYRRGTLDCWEGLAALAEIPPEKRDARVTRSIERGAEFYLRRSLMEEGKVLYPPWYRIHYPTHYYYDILVGLRMLTRLGYGGDRRLRPALDWLEEKQRPDGRWCLDATHPDLDPELTDYSLRNPFHSLGFEPPGAPSRWATVEALSVRTAVERARTSR
jgi:hypothetical protein